MRHLLQRTVSISPKPGSKFSAFGGDAFGDDAAGDSRQDDHAAVAGNTLEKARFGFDPGSEFHCQWERRRIDIVHAKFRNMIAGVTNGWKKYYWKPLAAYFKKADPDRGIGVSRCRAV